MNRFRGYGKCVIISAFSAALFSVSEEAADKANCLLNLLEGWKDGASFLKPSGFGEHCTGAQSPVVVSRVGCCVVLCRQGGEVGQNGASTEVAGGGVSEWRPSLSSSRLKFSLGKTPGLCRSLGGLRLTSWGKRDQTLEPYFTLLSNEPLSFWVLFSGRRQTRPTLA